MQLQLNQIFRKGKNYMLQKYTQYFERKYGIPFSNEQIEKQCRGFERQINQK